MRTLEIKKNDANQRLDKIFTKKIQNSAKVAYVQIYKEKVY